MAVSPGGGGGGRCPITTAVNDAIDLAVKRTGPLESAIDLRTLLKLIQHELDMRGTLSRSENRSSLAVHFFEAAEAVGRVLRVTA